MEVLATTAKKGARGGNMKQLYDTMKTLAEKYGKVESPVKDKEGRAITENQERRNREVEYFEELLHRPGRYIGRNQNELHTKFKDYIKYQPPDNLPAEVLESDGERTAKIIHVPFGKIWHHTTVSNSESL
ncbi:hypothetical protein MS3_00000656 [Schistosoma haematobium]|uniref:Uncharacterized protein n=1 Tax=Schistosoma haematobium TaxID=6185 RepID=A0A922IID7_SCHHA|nr:hypothetical protein MS3_00000656 [Schistosoma haematobium]KAH9580203.1 hypothetical protein MS3_00000656 [Schistosoma haematobium]